MTPFSYYYTNHFLWFRIFGYGLKIKHIDYHRLTFSERNGYVKFIMIGKWCVCWLKKGGKLPLN